MTWYIGCVDMAYWMCCDCMWIFDDWVCSVWGLGILNLLVFKVLLPWKHFIVHIPKVHIPLCTSTHPYLSFLQIWKDYNCIFKKWINYIGIISARFWCFHLLCVYHANTSAYPCYITLMHIYTHPHISSHKIWTKNLFSS